MLFVVVGVVHIAMLPLVSDDHSNRDVRLAPRQIENELSLTGIDISIQLYEVCSSVERRKCNPDIRER